MSRSPSALWCRVFFSPFGVEVVGDYSNNHAETAVPADADELELVGHLNNREVLQASQFVHSSYSERGRSNISGRVFLCKAFWREIQRLRVSQFARSSLEGGATLAGISVCLLLLR